MPRGRQLGAAASMIIGALVSASCGSSSGPVPAGGVAIRFTNSNWADVTIYGCPVACAGSAKIPGCGSPACPEPKPGEDPSGGVVGWTEMRKLPRQYRLALHGKPLNCPPVPPGPTAWNHGSYSVDYDITPSGHCVIVSRGLSVGP